MKKKIIFILGPTSSGKSKAAIDLAKKIDGEIISCDSMQVYKDMDIITQVVENCEVPHHLIKVIPPEEEFNAAKFVKMAAEALNVILKKGKQAIFAGGTGLYVKALLDGIFPAPSKDEELRLSFEKIAEEKGNEYLHNELKKVDPSRAAGLHYNDTRRIVRALEIFKLTGQTMDEKKSETRGIYNKYDCRLFGLSLPRELLYERVNSRVEKMFDDGLVKEVKDLRARALSLTAGKALGIKEAAAYLDGEMSMEESKEELKMNTRRYAKRQLTWFRADGRIEWLDADRDITEIVRDILTNLS
ncbi:MAG: tRNA (adenosine(37)-N6)-dimethylallyltransferase MiaA [Dehalococcoidia bacterium]|nr:MAG: tRNA (adenosine(37)-N6)-dimethylallyltransferase MiaA [Dehalococcoidia bacterium]